MTRVRFSYYIQTQHRHLNYTIGLIFIGEVIVQRLNLQVLWTQPPPHEDTKVCGIGWRPDERILAIGIAIFTTLQFHK